MSQKALRCAIYTRKSSEEGLEQDFNSLHAQREACEAYVKSQAGEGWRLNKTIYDDGGFSGGSMKRPALAQLLQDVDVGLIDVVVVYKVDRLTRSLTDFSRIVEVFDAKGVSFVSITQAFNTTTSMGRLTLNVLLSFAQFEREVTGERIRDKIAASKAKGMWMGGNVPLGYEVKDRKLLPVPAEAETVRHIFSRYLELGAVLALKHELDAEGYVSQRRAGRSGKIQGGEPFSRGTLFHLLENQIYVGLIRHKDKVYPGLHPAIVSQDLFDAVQAKLAANAVVRRERPLRSSTAWLKGKIFDADGSPMSPSFGRGKGGKAFRYYVSAREAGERSISDAVFRVSAPQIEALIQERLTQKGVEGEIATLDLRVELHRQAVHIVLPQRTLLHETSTADEVIQLEPGGGRRLVIAVRPVFRGGRTWLLGPNGASPFSTAQRDPALIKALRRAHQLTRQYGISPSDSAATLRTAANPPDAYLRKIVRLAYLAPDLQAAIVSGTLPPGVTLERLLHQPLPISWARQRDAILGSV